MADERYDYVIVGAGSAGCVLANRLSADPSTSVLLLEAGPKDSKREIKIPAAFPKIFKTEFDWAYETTPQRHVDDRVMYWPRGKTLGGSSAINAMMWVRGNPLDFDEWEQRGCKGWGWDEVLPYFRKAERHHLGSSPDRGGDGPQSVQALRSPNPYREAFFQAAADHGLPVRDDINVTSQEGVAPTPVTQDGGRRASAAHSYLHPVNDRDNLTVQTGALVTRVVLADRRAVGVSYRTGDGEHTVAAGREVILSGGAINSPQVLMLSGIGPAEQLHKHDIEPVHELPGVGQTLKDHLAYFVIQGTHGVKTLVDAESPANLLRYLFGHKGMLTSNVGEACGFFRAMPDAPAPDCELIFAPVPFMGHGLIDPPGPGLTIGPVLQRPRSVGELTLRSADPADPPVIDPRYLSDPAGHDLSVLVAGAKLARQLFAHEAFDGIRDDEIWPGDDVTSDDGIRDSIREHCQTLYHPIATCRMGAADDADAVVDPQLRVRGIAGLRVVDASIMPELVRGHTHAPTTMIAERASKLIAGAHAREGAVVA
ncbi:MAG: GMC family oxidoreductase [Solirubrobacterales bacterium]